MTERGDRLSRMKGLTEYQRRFVEATPQQRGAIRGHGGLTIGGRMPGGFGKTEAMRRQIQEQLDAGKTVLVVTPAGKFDGRQWLANRGLGHHRALELDRWADDGGRA